MEEPDHTSEDNSSECSSDTWQSLDEIEEDSGVPPTPADIQNSTGIDIRREEPPFQLDLSAISGRSESTTIVHESQSGTVLRPNPKSQLTPIESQSQSTTIVTINKLNKLGTLSSFSAEGIDKSPPAEKLVHKQVANKFKAKTLKSAEADRMIGDPFIEKGDDTSPASAGSGSDTMADTVILEGDSGLVDVPTEVGVSAPWATNPTEQPAIAGIGAVGGPSMPGMQGSRARTVLTQTEAGRSRGDTREAPPRVTNPFQFNRLSTMWTPATNSDQVLLRRPEESSRNVGWGDAVKIRELQETVKQMEKNLNTQREMIEKQNASFAEMQSDYVNHLADLTSDNEVLRERERQRINVKSTEATDFKEPERKKLTEKSFLKVAYEKEKEDNGEGDSRVTKSLEAEVQDLRARLSEERGKRLDAELCARLAEVATSVEAEESDDSSPRHGDGDHKHGTIIHEADEKENRRGSKRRSPADVSASPMNIGQTRTRTRSESSDSGSDAKSRRHHSSSRARRDRRHRHRRSSSASSRSLDTRNKDRLPKFNPDSNDQWREYHAIFERTADRRKWTPEQRLDKLILLLDGSARSVFFYNKQASYTELVHALDETYNPSGSRSAAYFTFRNRKMGAKEPIEKYVGELRRLAKEAYPEMDPKSLDSTIAHQFLDGIRGDPEMYQHVAMCDQTDLIQVRAGAERWRNFKTGVTTGPAAPATTHTSSVNVVFNGNSKNKDKDKKKSKGGKDKRKAGNKPDYNCHYCDKKGHSYRDCWKMAEENPNWKPKRKNNNRNDKRSNKWNDNRSNNRDNNRYDSRPRSRDRRRSDTPERRYRSSSRSRGDRRERHASPYESRRTEDRSRVNQIGEERSRDSDRSREN